MSYITLICTVCGTISTVGGAVAMIYALSRFVSKPNRTQDERLQLLEDRTDELERWIKRGDEHFRAQDDLQGVISLSMMSVMDALATLPDLPADSKAKLLTQKDAMNQFFTCVNRFK
jgi:hypothetical protein